MIFAIKIFLVSTIVIALVGGMVAMAFSAPWYVTAWLLLFMAGICYLTVIGEFE